jgi:predicted permease
MFDKRKPTDFNAEIEAHIEFESERLRQEGLSDKEARNRARRAFGNVAAAEERYYESSRWAWLDHLTRNIRFGARTLAKSPGFTVVTILTLALGIGANTAIFSLMNAIMLRNLPVHQPSELVLFGDGRASGDDDSLPEGETRLFSYDTLRQFQGRTDVFSDVAAVRSSLFTTHGRVGSAAEMEKIQVELVSGNYFTTLGVSPAAGRVLNSADDATPGGHPVAVASYSWWQRRFDRMPSTAGTPVNIAGTVYTIVGVAAPEFGGVSVGQPVDLWIPLAMDKQIAPGWSKLNDKLFQTLYLIGRLKPGVTVAQAGANTNVLFQQIIHEYAGPKASDGDLKAVSHARIHLTSAASGLSRLRRQVEKPLQILMAVVAVVLLIACANVANLLLARAAARRREFALRLSIGATRPRLIQQLVIESSLLGLAGGALGVCLAWGASNLLVRMVSTGSDPLHLRVAPDLPVLAFALVVTMATVILFGTLPALRATRLDLAASLKEGRGIVGTPLRNRLARALVVTQVALSLALVAGAGLFLRVLSNLEHIDTGFDRNNVLMADIDPAAAGYQDDERFNQTLLRLEDRLASVPGVKAASFALSVFAQGGWGADVVVPGHTNSEQDPDVDHNRVGVGYMKAMGIPIVLGRDFSTHDSRESPKVAIINETFARTFYPGVSPIGRTFSIHGARDVEWGNLEIIGVSRDAKYISLQEKPYAAAFYPTAQHRAFLESLVFRYTGDSRQVIPRVRSAIHEIAPDLPVGDFVPLSRKVDDSIQNRRIVAHLCTLFALLATLLASIGIYGVMSYAIARRTNEFGIRMALGAVRRDVLWMVLRDALALVAIGVAAGIGIALASGRLVESVLYGIKPADPLTIAGAVVMMALVGLLAGWLPARRATRIEPTVALRYE